MAPTMSSENARVWHRGCTTPLVEVLSVNSQHPENRYRWSEIRSIGTVKSMNSVENNISTSLDTKEMSDSLLVTSAKSGDSVAFVELCQRYSKILLRRIYRITKNWEDAEDVLQDSFIRAYVHLGNFEGRSAFSSWLTRIAINSALMNLRKRRPYCEISIDGTNDDSGTDDRWDLRDSAEDPEKRYERREREELLKGAIVQLRPGLRKILELQRAQEYSTKELAQALGISVAATKSRLLRARMALRASLLIELPG